MDRDDKSPWFPITPEEVIRKYGIAEDVGRGIFICISIDSFY